MSKSVAVWSIALVLGSVSCGGKSGTYSAACDTFATAICDRNDQCSGGYANIASFGSSQACQTAEARHCIASHPVIDANDSVAIIDGCAASLIELSCQVLADGPTTAACLVPGFRVLGSGCYSDLQCASAHCSVAVGSPCGTCNNPPTAGSPCTAATGFSCTGGAVCNRATQTCEAPANVGVACNDANVMCGYGLQCTGKTGSRTCQALAIYLEALCDADSQTAPACDASYGLACSPTTSMCVAATRANIGQPCGLSPGQQRVLCESGAVCSFASIQSDEGTCVARAPIGAVCTPETATSDGVPCIFPGVCVQGGGVTGSYTCQEIVSATCE